MANTVLIADDHPLILEGIVNQMKSDSQFMVVATSNNGIEALELFIRFHPDICILDIDMAGMTGIELTERIKKQNIQSKVLLLTMHSEPWVLFKAKMANPDGILLKNSPAGDLLITCLKVLKGEKVFACEVQSSIMEGSLMNQALLTLTARESEILKLITQGLSTKEMAEKAFISVNTVETYRKNLFRKFNVGNMAELVRKAIEMGIVK